MADISYDSNTPTIGSIALPTGASTSAKQDTGNVSLASIDGKITAVNTGAVVISSAIPAGSNVIGHVIVDSGSVTTSGLTDTQLRASAVPISGTVTANAGSGPFPVSDNAGSLTVDNNGTFAVQATLGAETTKVIGTVNIAASQSVQASQSGTWTVQPGNTVNTTAWKVDGSAVTQPVSGPVTDTQLRASAVPVSLAAVPSHAVTNAGTFAVQATLAAETTKVIGTVNVASAQSIDVTNAGTFATQPSAPTLTKGTQGATGYSTQDLKDSGRTSLSFYATGVASGTTTTETAISLTKSSGTGATSSAASFVVTSGKRFRITNISVASRGNSTATAQVTTFNLRINTGGAVTTSSTPLVFAARSATPATALAWDRVILPIPDGYEILGNGTLQFGITANSVFVTNAPTWDVNIMGFEY